MDKLALPMGLVALADKEKTPNIRQSHLVLEPMSAVNVAVGMAKPRADSRLQRLHCQPA